MFDISIKGWSLDKDLQIIQADVLMAVDDSIIIEEPLCVDVGLPAFLYSALHDTAPNRFAPADQWERMPFFVCGCGDPECRGFSFVVRHLADDQVELVSVEERSNGTYRELETHILPSLEYSKKVLAVGEAYLAFIKGLDYRPYFGDTVKVVEDLVHQIHQQLWSE
ncbi:MULTISPECIES: hypothetical protein [unclassified Paenibacillus]|uniref:hypothetical protein n=1 Tax=unclassified Paenibacillus TaxID=185978 RepID=UPI00070B5318|nr:MULTISPECIES: hypothetical protein [unclassified Paenibacillus]KQX45316.1 hypothetical protein ASD40_20515 [Paenibacillus sp. Root444D2]KRE45661.1 hypothetical protein ASG85_06435 [Paenibacillus sp. Soil724D2]